MTHDSFIGIITHFNSCGCFKGFCASPHYHKHTEGSPNQWHLQGVSDYFCHLIGNYTRASRLRTLLIVKDKTSAWKVGYRHLSSWVPRMLLSWPAPPRGAIKYHITRGGISIVYLTTPFMSKTGMCVYTVTLLCHRYAQGKIFACAPLRCTQLPPRPRNRLFPWRPCSTGCCGTDVPGIRKPTPVSGGNWEQSCQPCPHFRLSVAVSKVFWYSVIHKNRFILNPRVPLVLFNFLSRESAEIGHFCFSCMNVETRSLIKCKSSVTG